MAHVFACDIRLKGGSVLPQNCYGQGLLPRVFGLKWFISMAVVHHGSSLSWPEHFHEPFAFICIDISLTGTSGTPANVMLQSVEGKKKWAREHRRASAVPSSYS